MDAPAQRKLDVLKKAIFQLDLSGVVELYRRVTGTNYNASIEVKSDFQRYIYLRAKYPDKNMPPSLELDIFWSLLARDGGYENINRELSKLGGIILPQYQRYFYQKKYISSKDRYYFQQVTQNLFLQEFSLKLISKNINTLIRFYRLIKVHFLTIITLVIPAVIGTIITSYVAEKELIHETHKAVDKVTRLVTYSNEHVYTICNGPIDFPDSSVYYKIIFDTNDKMRDVYEQFALVVKAAFDEGLITNKLLEELTVIAKYNDKISLAGLNICTVPLKDIETIYKMRAKALKAIRASEDEKAVNLLDYLF